LPRREYRRIALTPQAAFQMPCASLHQIRANTAL
jgi:hypothetical protein